MRELCIGGEWRDARSGATRTIRCPADGTVVAEVAEGGRADAEDAIAAARAAFDAGRWSDTSWAERADLVGRVGDLLQRDREALARSESLDTGKRLVESLADIDDVTAVFRHYATIRHRPERLLDVGRGDVTSRVVREPVGVCGLITPWNYPMLQAAWKVAPCLLAGNTFVLKPSELTPHTAVLLTRLLHEAGLPDGVANLVLGPGPAVGAPLAADPRVDLVSFTGGLATGKAIMKSAADTVKRVALELGGKNPNIVFADADRETSLDMALTAVFIHSGQVCSAGARLLVEDSIHDDFVNALVTRAGRIRLGGPFDESAQTGPLISADHLAKVMAYVELGIDEGAELRLGGLRATEGPLAAGYYFPPTILDRCHRSMRVVQEESFGPVLTVESFSCEDEAITLANDSIYGLAGGVWTTDSAKADRVASRLRMGTVWINVYHPYVPQAEWGGYKQSGIGRELGLAGLDEYCEIKHIWRNTEPAPQGWFSP